MRPGGRCGGCAEGDDSRARRAAVASWTTPRRIPPCAHTVDHARRGSARCAQDMYCSDREALQQCAAARPRTAKPLRSSDVAPRRARHRRTAHRRRLQLRPRPRAISRICQLPLYCPAVAVLVTALPRRSSSSRRRVVFATRCAAAALGGEQSSASSSSAAARSAAAARTALQRGRGPDERQRCVP